MIRARSNLVQLQNKYRLAPCGRAWAVDEARKLARPVEVLQATIGEAVGAARRRRKTTDSDARSSDFPESGMLGRSAVRDHL